METPNTFVTIYNVWRLDKYPTTFVIMFGNYETGWGCEYEDLKRVWGVAIRNSKSNRVGDVTLLKNGKLIRGVNNANMPILIKKHNDPNRHGNYECTYTKYDGN